MGMVDDQAIALGGCVSKNVSQFFGILIVLV